VMVPSWILPVAHTRDGIAYYALGRLLLQYHAFQAKLKLYQVRTCCPTWQLVIQLHI